ncbi:MAG: glycoside hydrolase family 38 C-terminal domain-containing protein, partial [Actinomycetota bacterium]
VLTADRDLGSLEASVLEGEAVLDRTSVDATGGRHSVLLFVPEVRDACSMTFVLSGGGAELLRAPVEIRPQRKWSVYVVHHSHLDVGYTDIQSSVWRHHRAYLDSVVDLVTATDDRPEEARFRWNVEANWTLRDWMRSRPRGPVEELFRRARQGRIEVAALPFSMHTEAYSIDELARMLWFADELREDRGLEIVTAMQTDVPGATDGLLQLLTGAGIRYLSVAHNYAGRSVPHLVGGRALTRPFYWRAPSGARLLVWYTDTPHGVYMEGNHLGLADDYESALALLPEYLAALAERPYPYMGPTFGWEGVGPDGASGKAPYPFDLLHLRVQGSYGDNAGPSLVPADIVGRWNETWAYPKLRMATNRDFFTCVEERLGDRIETYEGDWTDWWADGIGSAARELGFNRRAQSAVRSAMTLHGVADRLDAPGAEDGGPGDACSWWAEMDRCYERMALFDEHTWGAANPWEDGLEHKESGALQWATKAAFADDARESSERLVESGLHRVASSLSSEGAEGSGVVVLNTTARRRTDVVRVLLPESRVRAESVEIVDEESGEPVACVIEPQSDPAHRPRGIHASFVARDVPPFGYALYRITAAGGVSKDHEAPPEPFIENEHYRVELDVRRGVASRFLDRAAGRDLIGDAPFGFGQYIYDRYATAPHFNHLSSSVGAGDMGLLGSRTVADHGVLVRRSSTAVWDRLTVRLTGDGIEWLESTLTLLRGVKRLDISNRLYKRGRPEKESVYFAFPFDAPGARIRYETTGGVSGPDLPHVPGSARHMRALRHWVAFEAASDKIVWATREAPLVQLGNLHLPYAPFPATLEPEQRSARGSRRSAEGGSATVYSWALNNIWDTNFPSRQGGEMEFGYAVATGSEDTVDLGAATADAMTAPLLGVAAGPAPPGMPVRGSFCRVDRPDVEVVALTRSRRGHDLQVLLRSLAPGPGDATISFPLARIRRAWAGNHLERDLEEAGVRGQEVRVALPPGELRSLSLELDGPMRLGP